MMAKLGNFFESMFKPFKSRSEREGQREEDLETIAAREHRLFSIETLVSATQNFDSKNKLGAGGFGPVYKGKLPDGRIIAVKKLSHSSNQGKKEFMNEARLLARVQHRNVVNLLGYCVHDVEKLLVYEYVANESLDKLLFDASKQNKLDWKKRFDVILGVARGLLYLHEDSHCCIIHRDIKASNVLLDEKWVPKIADFGMARLFPEDQTHINTRVAGTNGYMAPEYLMHGTLSVKADVFSFGVLMLELVCGKKNSSFNFDPEVQSLLEWVWRHFKKRRPLEIMDPSLATTEAIDQVEMCTHIGLLCTQADPKLRPTMKRVVVLLSKKPGVLEEPTKPGFPGSRYRRSKHSGSTSYGESSRGAAAGGSVSTSNTLTGTTTTTTLSPRDVTTRGRVSTSNPVTGSYSTATLSPIQQRSREKRPIQNS